MDNVDSREIEKFSESASRWWDLDGEYKPLHDINPLRLQYIQQQFPVAGCRVLDVGCGGGILSESLARAGASVTGIDMSEAALGVARLHALEQGLQIDYQHCTVEAFAEQHPAQYDLITCMEMLEHIPQPASIVSACAKLAKPGAGVVFSTLNRNRKSWLFAIAGAEYVLKLLPRGTHDWQKFIKPSELGGWCREAGLQMQDLHGMGYNPLARNYYLQADVSVNYLMSCQRAQPA